MGILNFSPLARAMRLVQTHYYDCGGPPVQQKGSTPWARDCGGDVGEIAVVTPKQLHLISSMLALAPGNAECQWLAAPGNGDRGQELLDFLNANLVGPLEVTPEAKAFGMDAVHAWMEGYKVISFSPLVKYPPNSNYESLYPNLTILLKEYIPYLSQDNRLIETIHNLTGLPNEDIIYDLQWDNGPEINISQLGFDPYGNQYYGKFNRQEPEKIFIDIDFVNQLESISNVSNPTQAQMELMGSFNSMLIFSICLHEYVHYADYAFDGSMQDNENLELGLLFEELFLGGFYDFDQNGNLIFIRKN